MSKRWVHNVAVTATPAALAALARVEDVPLEVVVGELLARHLSDRPELDASESGDGRPARNGTPHYLVSRFRLVDGTRVLVVTELGDPLLTTILLAGEY